jgi:predicted DNA-binding protein
MDDKIVTTSFRIPVALKKSIESVAKERERPSGYIIIEALNHYLQCQVTQNGSTKKKAGTR